MAKFTNHRQYAVSRHLRPYACFGCRKSFKRNVLSGLHAPDGLPCPQCGQSAIGLDQKFKPPRRNDAEQWRKVEALVRQGFRFQSVGEPYPKTFAEVDAFVRRHAGKAIVSAVRPMHQQGRARGER